MLLCLCLTLPPPSDGFFYPETLPQNPAKFAQIGQRSLLNIIFFPIQAMLREKASLLARVRRVLYGEIVWKNHTKKRMCKRGFIKTFPGCSRCYRCPRWHKPPIFRTARHTWRLSRHTSHHTLSLLAGAPPMNLALPDMLSAFRSFCAFWSSCTSTSGLLVVAWGGRGGRWETFVTTELMSAQPPDWSLSWRAWGESGGHSENAYLRC